MNNLPPQKKKDNQMLVTLGQLAVRHKTAINYKTDGSSSIASFLPPFFVVKIRRRTHFKSVGFSGTPKWDPLMVSFSY